MNLILTNPKPNTVNKVNRFVMVFALPLHLDRFLMVLASGLRATARNLTPAPW